MSPTTTPPASTRWLLATSGALLVSLALGSSAMAAAQKSAAANGNKLPSKVTFIDSPSSESPAARKKRLKIECKGRPNAGACLGMTR